MLECLNLGHVWLEDVRPPNPCECDSNECMQIWFDYVVGDVHVFVHNSCRKLLLHRPHYTASGCRLRQAQWKSAISIQQILDLC